MTRQICNGVPTPSLAKSQDGSMRTVMKRCYEPVMNDPKLKVCARCLKTGDINTFPHVHAQTGEGLVMQAVEAWPEGVTVEKVFQGKFCKNGHGWLRQTARPGGYETQYF